MNYKLARFLFSIPFFISSLRCAQQSIELIIPSNTENFFNQNQKKSAELTIVTHLGAGFFCEFHKVLESLFHFEEEGLSSIWVNWTHEFFPYKDSPSANGWDAFFDPITPKNLVQNNNSTHVPKTIVSGSGYHELHDAPCYDHWVRYEQHLPYRLAANNKINEYIKIKDHIWEKVNQFHDAHMQGFTRIGVQVRYASAHASEVPGRRNPPLEHYIAEAKKIIKDLAPTPCKIYLATDSNYVVSEFKKHFSEEQLLYIDAFRAQNNEDPHLIYENQRYWLTHPEEFHKKKPGYKGGETALMDCLLLSKCDYFIHTTSNLANFVVYFNPYIKSIYLPKGLPIKPCRYKNDPGIKNKWLCPI